MEMCKIRRIRVEVRTKLSSPFMLNNLEEVSMRDDLVMQSVHLSCEVREAIVAKFPIRCCISQVIIAK